MIKLIASDLDGTLLDEHKNLPPRFFETLDILSSHGVTFIAASGRSYTTLHENFMPRSDEMCFICDNGACVVENGIITEKDTLSRQATHRIIKACEAIENIHLILCGAHGSHITPYSPWFVNEVDKYYVNRNIVPDLYAVEDDIFKIAICDMAGSASNVYPILAPLFKDELNLAVSGDVWMDVMNKDVNKGSALEKIQQRLGITPEETMAFGDYYNDVELLKRAKYSFVMENSNKDMKQYGNYIARSNRENGVMQAINQYVLSVL